MSIYTIIAFPQGARQVVATMHGLTRRDEQMVQYAAAIAGVSPGSEADAMVNRAITHAKLRGEYVDVYRDDQHIAIVGPEGPIA